MFLHVMKILTDLALLHVCILIFVRAPGYEAPDLNPLWIRGCAVHSWPYGRVASALEAYNSFVNVKTHSTTVRSGILEFGISDILYLLRCAQFCVYMNISQIT